MSHAINRRTLIKGTAWVAPTIIGTSTMPVYAASANICENYNVMGEVFLEIQSNQENNTVFRNGYVNISFSRIPIDGAVTDITIQAPPTTTFASTNGTDWELLDNGKYIRYTGAPITEAFNEETYTGFSAFLLLNMDDFDSEKITAHDHRVIYNETCTSTIPVFVSFSDAVPL